jgi:hypothetical protein
MCKADIAVEVRVRWWVKWMMHAACWIAWCLRGRARQRWLGFVMCDLVPWMMSRGVSSKIMPNETLPKA